jgi:hypothetical protein
VDVLRTTTGAYSLEVDESDPSGLVTRTVRVTLYCKYVRRELRSLTLEDREKYLTAAATLWKVRTAAAAATLWKSTSKVHTRDGAAASIR